MSTTMLQKFALAVKSKTIEFFADDDDDADDRSSCLADLDSLPTVSFADLALEAEVITGQRVVVLKPDPPPPPPDPETLAAAAFATLSSFRSAYLQIQTADSPFQADALRSADRAAVSHLRRLSELRRLYFSPPPPPPAPALSSHLEAQVLENQSLLRAFDPIVNRLQADIDGKDAEADDLDRSLRDLEATISRLADRLERACAPPEENVESLLSVGVFDAVLRDTCRVAHRFARVLVDLMKRSGWDLRAAADGIHPGVEYAKPGHCRYAILSYVCLGMLGGFDSCEFSLDGIGGELDEIDVTVRRNDFLQQFIEHSDSDALIVMRDHPTCDFANFCRSKYEELIHPGIESALLGQPDDTPSFLRSFTQSSPLYEPFVSMASSIWMLHKLAWAYDPVVEIFQVARGKQFSMVFMENIARKPGEKMAGNFHLGSRTKVGFTVIPGFRIGKTVIQCRVYLEGLKQPI